MRSPVVNMLRRYLNNFYAKNYSPEVLELWSKHDWSYDQYLQCSKEILQGHESRVAKLTLSVVLLLSAAAILWIADFAGLSVVLLILALRAYFLSRQHMLVAELLQVNGMLARLRN